LSEHYFTPHLEFAPPADPDWIRDAIQTWERGDQAEQPAIIGTNGQPLPSFPELVGGLVEHRWGRFTADPSLLYRLRLEVSGRERRRVRIGLLFSGPELPDEHTRGGGELVRRLSTNWRHRPQEQTFPTRLREVGSSAGVSELITRLLDPSRRVPVLLVTRRSGTDEVVADADRLLGCLMGMAEVWSLPKTGTTRELGQAFMSRGFDARWNCYDGGVRVYLPGFDPAVDVLGKHPLVLASRLAGTDPTAAAASWALGTVTRALGVDTWRATWRQELAHEHGAAEPQPTLGDVVDLRRDTRPPEEPAEHELDEPPEALAPQPPADLPPDPASPSPDADADAEPPATEAEAPPAPPAPPAAKPEAPPSRFQRALTSLKDAFDVFVDLEQLVQEFQEELDAVRQDRDALARERDELSQELQDRESEAEYAIPDSLPGLLRMYAELSDGSLRVTDYALRKADDSRYANLKLVARVLATFIALGPDFGAVDAAFLRQLGRRVRARPRESPQTLAKFGDRREFPLDDGQLAVVSQHVTLGHGARNANETLQIYWRRAADGGTEIVYVGAHLPTVSENT